MSEQYNTNNKVTHRERRSRTWLPWAKAKPDLHVCVFCLLRAEKKGEKGAVLISLEAAFILACGLRGACMILLAM